MIGIDIKYNQMGTKCRNDHDSSTWSKSRNSFEDRSKGHMFH